MSNIDDLVRPNELEQTRENNVPTSNQGENRGFISQNSPGHRRKSRRSGEMKRDSIDQHSRRRSSSQKRRSSELERSSLNQGSPQCRTRESIQKCQERRSISGKNRRMSRHYSVPRSRKRSRQSSVQPIPIAVKPRIERQSQREDMKGVSSNTLDFSRDENPLRGNWGGRLDFILSSLGYCVGLGNVWRFPYLCFSNGGGIFLIPYTIVLILVGIPLMSLEALLGQYTSSGALTCWKFAPFFGGLGIAIMVVSSTIALYYNIIIAWSFYYLIRSLTNTLPWSDCSLFPSSELCRTKIPDMTKAECIGKGYDVNSTDGLCYDNNTKKVALWNIQLSKAAGIKRSLPASEYLFGEVLGFTKSSGIDNVGELHWDLALSFFVVWIFVYLTLLRGVKSSGKVVYFTALFPYLVMFILLVRGVILEGHLEGVEFYLRPNFTKLAEAKVWKDAVSQVFFSLGVGQGGLIVLSSYNRFHNDILRDILIVGISDTLTSFFAGFVIFSYIGFLAKDMGQSIEEVAKAGVGLAFVIYPEALARMPIAPLWSVLFFMMLLTLGFDSQCGLVEVITTSLMDVWPKLREKKAFANLGICGAFYLAGLSMCTDGGLYVLNLLDQSTGWNTMFLVVTQCLTIIWVYGFKRFNTDIKCMLGHSFCGCLRWKTCSYYFFACWGVLSPLFIFGIMIYTWKDYKRLREGEDYIYPDWAEALTWIIESFGILGIFVYAGYYVYTSEGRTLKEKIQRSLQPAREWGPALTRHRKLVAKYSPHMITTPWSTESKEQIIGASEYKEDKLEEVNDKDYAELSPDSSIASQQNYSLQQIDNSSEKGKKLTELSKTSSNASNASYVNSPVHPSSLSSKRTEDNNLIQSEDTISEEESPLTRTDDKNLKQNEDTIPEEESSYYLPKVDV